MSTDSQGKEEPTPEEGRGGGGGGGREGGRERGRERGEGGRKGERGGERQIVRKGRRPEDGTRISFVILLNCHTKASN